MLARLLLRSRSGLGSASVLFGNRGTSLSVRLSVCLSALWERRRRQTGEHH